MTGAPRQLRVLLCDDDLMISEALRDVLAVEPDLDVVAIGQNADEAVSLAVEHEPDVAVVDMRMPGGGAHAVAGIRQCSPRTRVVAFTAYGDPSAREEMRAAGAIAYLLKGVSIDELVATIRRVGGISPSH
ncbi:Response regulator receiver domain-containing protein [Micromonospora pattaloongensis]|uniref:Response regulator receiver domain-containing protein n=1 Tax=Micromonospora pattaloongensis TaxID=405436 RepID=A0A1H3NRP4_9ACTN|nr:response regulator transcription factor [Micromonospora pattaloongensis]SDY91105.1 Response regulator receiver domain-containing protein [Micromonospora pattaloongensis]